jgi:PAS domain S-box-containing protein
MIHCGFREANDMPGQLNQTQDQRTDELAAVNQALHSEITKRNRHEQQLAGQYRVSRILAESASLDEAAAKILQAVCESVEWDLGDIWIIDRQANTLRCVDIWHSPLVEAVEFEAITRQIRFPPGVGLPGRVWVSGEPAWIPDVVKDANFPRAPFAAENGLHGAFGFPIRLGSQILGVFEFFSHEIRQPDYDLLQIFACIGSQIGQFIERKQAEEALRKAHDELELRVQERTAELVNANAALEAEISEHRRTEAELRESEERFRQITAMTGEWIWEQDTEGCYIYSSSGVKSILGLKPEQVIGKYYYELFAPEDKAQITPGIIETTRSFFRLVNRYKHKDGHEVFTESSGTPIFDAETKLLKWRGIDHDITERKHFEDALRLRDCAIEASSVGIIISDANQPGRPIIYSNSAFIRMTGYSREEVIGRNARFLQGPDTDPKAIEEIRLALREERHCHITLKNYRKDGAFFWNELLISPVRYEKGKLTHFIGIQTDVTRLRRAEEERHEMEIARQIQISLLPMGPLQIEGALIAGYCQPAAHVGGDYFDYFCAQNVADIVIADVSGHSIGAALIMAETRSTLKVETHRTLQEKAGLILGAADILHVLNNYLYEDLNRADLFITMFYMKYHVATRQLLYANAGHNHPLLLRQGEKTCKELDAEGLILGVKNEVIFEEKSLSLDKGDMVLLYTDGITEARNKEGEFFGVARLTDLFVAHSESSPQCVIDMVVKELRDFCQSRSFNDDISMVVLKIT